jgi:hypothetical protein
MITTDRNLRYQQNLTYRSLAIVVLWTTNWPELRKHVEMIVGAVKAPEVCRIPRNPASTLKPTPLTFWLKEQGWVK